MYTSLALCKCCRLFLPTNTIIVFDIHGVLFKCSYWKMIKCALSIPNKRIIFFLFFKPKFWLSIYRTYRQYKTPEAFFIMLAKQYPQINKFKKSFIKIMNLQKPNKQIFKIIKNLKLNGFKLDILSNIGNETFENLKKKFPAVFKNFKNAHVIKRSNNFISKPNTEAFEPYANLSDKNIIFIDDKKANVNAAKESGLYGIYFSSAQNLVNEFKRLGIL